MDRRAFVSILATVATSSVLQRADAQGVPNAPNVVLVHGLFADGSCWSEVIARLQPKGIQVTAVQNPLTTLDDAVAETQRVLDRQDGPTVLAGHSFSGMIVTEAGVHPNVSAVVYVAARAPDAEEDYAALASKFPTPPATAGIVFDGDEGRLSRLHFFAILPAICLRRELGCSMRSNSRFTRRFRLARLNTPPGVSSRASMQFRRMIERSTPIWSGSWPSAWARKQSRSKQATWH